MPKIFSSIDGGILFFVGLLLLIGLLLIIEFSILDLGYFICLLLSFIYYLHIKKF